jgi:hypothetical protein
MLRSAASSSRNEVSKPRWAVLSQWCTWTKCQQKDDLDQFEKMTTVVLRKARIRQPECECEQVDVSLSVNGVT